MNLLAGLQKLLGQAGEQAGQVINRLDLQRSLPALTTPNRPIAPGYQPNYVGNEPARPRPSNPAPRYDSQPPTGFGTRDSYNHVYFGKPMGTPAPLLNVPDNFIPFNREGDFNMPWRVDQPRPFLNPGMQWQIPTQMTAPKTVYRKI